MKDSISRQQVAMYYRMRKYAQELEDELFKKSITLYILNRRVIHTPDVGLDALIYSLERDLGISHLSFQGGK